MDPEDPGLSGLVQGFVFPPGGFGHLFEAVVDDEAGECDDVQMVFEKTVCGEMKRPFKLLLVVGEVRQEPEEHIGDGDAARGRQDPTSRHAVEEQHVFGIQMKHDEPGDEHQGERGR
ncbi:hypothetical protein [Bhargavaea cecembensis]|uniref:hypothetical protein n=1 Tax=Bhargavaea cecembensis TaxID=394098 RepID=UPI000693306A|nr:hypothetical protein [Bhargavaea cecembensis]